MSMLSMAEQVKAYCARVGEDPLLVQGAGGNASWKEDNLLWVKASGTWLANAEKEDIFISVDLADLRERVSSGDFCLVPKVVGQSTLRPSIETILHGLMPHNVVVHLHAVEVLAYLVKESAFEELSARLGSSLKWLFVNYFKPGADLARAVHEQLEMHPDADVVFLKNHGVVIGGANTRSVEQTLEELILSLQVKAIQATGDSLSPTLELTSLPSGYVRCVDEEINQLAVNSRLFSRLKNAWALYPDHIVFLGAEASIVEAASDFVSLQDTSTRPHYIFIAGHGVFANESVAESHQVQLRCYYDVLVRQSEFEELSSLTSSQVAELLGWDAEKYRQSLAV